MNQPMISLKIMLILVLATVTVSPGCTTTSPADDGPSNDSCGATTATWDTIQVIINNECISCHEPGGGIGGVELDSYESVVSHMESGLLLASIKREDGVMAMPPVRALPDCDVEKFEGWQERGYPQ